MTVELLTNPERRRRWSTEEKARIVAEAKAPGALVAAIARRYGVSRGLPPRLVSGDPSCEEFSDGDYSAVHGVIIREVDEGGDSAIANLSPDDFPAV